MDSTIVSIIHHPFALELGAFTLTGFGIAMLAAFVIAQIVSQSVLARRGQDPDVMPDMVIAAVVGGLLGGKVYYAILTGDATSLVERAGFVFWGGLMGGILATAAWMRYKKLSFTKISDASAPALAAAYAVGRTGCWAVGDDYGSPWWSRFAVRFPEGSPPSSVYYLTGEFSQKDLLGLSPAGIIPVYPTQLFEVAMGLVMFAVLWRLKDHKHAAGWLFGVYCVLAGIERIVVEVFRAKDDRFFGPFTMAQAIGLAFLIGGATWMQFRRKSPAVAATG